VVSVGSANRWLLVTALGLVALTALTMSVLKPTFDLAYYLPKPTSEQEAVLVERLGQGAGARLVFAEIQSQSADASAIAATLKETLAASPLFVRVENGQFDLGLSSFPPALWNGRYLLADVDWTVDGLRVALQQRLQDMSSMGSPEFSDLMAADPTWAAMRAAEGLQFSGMASELRWSEGEQRAFMVLETKAAPFDLSAQQDALTALRSAYRTTAGTDQGLALYGVGVYSTMIKARVQRESTWLGLAATSMVLLVVFLAYRSWRLMLISLVPLACAVLGGMLLSTLLFGAIHGITIAFGATLLGVVDDYPMHIFSHARHTSAQHSVRRLFITLLGSAGTAMVAYLALALSGSRGLAQLGVFSLGGVLCAMLVTCVLLPKLIPSISDVAIGAQDTVPQRFALSMRVWVPGALLAVALIIGLGGLRWNDNLGDLTPLPQELLQRDHDMRVRLGTPDPRYLLTLTGGTVEEALRGTEQLTAKLGQAKAKGLVSGWSSALAVLPSEQTQLRRRGAIPEAAVLADSLRLAISDTPLASDAFEPFLKDAVNARTQALVTPATLRNGVLGDYLDSHLSRVDGRWRSSVYLAGIQSVPEFTEWLAVNARGALLVDLKMATQSLVRSYRERLLDVLVIALLAIAAIVFWTTRKLRRFLWCMGTVLAAIGCTLGIMVALHTSFTLFHLVSLMLVAGLGVDYCLFYSRPDVSRTEFLDSGHALLACSASTIVGFAILGASSIPMLSTIGLTVAMGTAIMYLMARFGCRLQEKS
jgi:predicted exporter